MVKPTLTIALSRRAILAGATAVPVAAQSLIQALAALPEPASLAPDPSTDAELFRRIAEAEGLRNEYARARRFRDRIREARRARAEVSPQPRRGPIPPCDIDAYLHYSELFYRYADAVRAAVDVPARTAAGLQAKLALAVIASRRGGARIYMYEDREWLEITLADLRRLAERQEYPAIQTVTAKR